MTMTATNHLAAYEAHHNGCEDCGRAISPRNRRQRCAEGAALWDAYATHHQAADTAYQVHHFGCATCIGAGIALGRGTRCPEGTALWQAYNDAGVPPQLWTAPHVRVFEVAA